MPKKKVSLHDIVYAIDKAIKEFDEGATDPTAAKDENVERAKRILKGVRESVEGICMPNFDVPVG